MYNDMDEMTVLIKKVRPSAHEPAYETAGAAAMDVRACLDGPVILPPGGRFAVPTGLAIALPSGDVVALLFSRSGHGLKQGVALANGVGVIDADYRGEILVALENRGDKAFTVADGDRVAQMAILPVRRAALAWADELPGSVRGAGGFGSTGER